MICVGLAALGVLLSTTALADVRSAVVIALLVVVGSGSGLFIGPNAAHTLAAANRARVGLASGLFGTAQRSGTAVGISASAAVLGPTAYGMAPAIWVCVGLAAAGAIAAAIAKRGTP